MHLVIVCDLKNGALVDKIYVNNIKNFFLFKISKVVQYNCTKILNVSCHQSSKKLIKIVLPLYFLQIHKEGR